MPVSSGWISSYSSIRNSEEQEAVQRDLIRIDQCILYPPSQNNQPNTGGAGVQKANAPGALAVGHEGYIKPENEKIDFAELANQLAELVTKIRDIFDSTTITVTSTSTDVNGSTNVFTTTRPPGFPASATGCADAQTRLRSVLLFFLGLYESAGDIASRLLV